MQITTESERRKKGLAFTAAAEDSLFSQTGGRLKNSGKSTGLSPVYAGGHPVPSTLTGKSDRGVYLANLPIRQKGSELVGYTPRLQDLIEDAMPLFWHILERNLIESDRPVHLFYVNSAEPLQENGRRLIDLFTRLSGTDRICLPISSCHSMLVNTFRFAMPYLREMDLDEVALVYIGENANRKTMSTVSKECGMAFYFHAFY